MKDRISKPGWLLLLSVVWIGCGAEAPDTSATTAAVGNSSQSERGAEAGGALRIDDVRLSPDEPVVGGSVQADVRTSGAPSHETMLSYEWFVNGNRQDETGRVLRLQGGIAKGSLIEVVVVARRDEQRSKPAKADVRIGNTAPVLHRLVFEPAREIDASQDVMVIPNATDFDEDELEFEYSWEVNGRRHDSRTAVLPAKELKRGDEIRVRVRAGDGEDWSKAIASDVIRVRNADPRITSSPGTFDDQGRFVYEIQVEDPDGDRSFGYRLLEGPEGMSLDVVDATLRWTPNQAQAGRHPVRVEVSDRNGGVATQSFVVQLGFEETGEAVPAAAEEPY